MKKVRTELSNEPKTGLALTGAIGAGLFASACCTIPILLVVAGVGGALLSTLRMFEPLRPLFVALAVALLSYAFYQNRKAVAAEHCAPGDACSEPATRRRNRLLLYLGASVTFLLIFSPILISWALS